jgi:C1A family cysteine protease
MGAIFLSDSAYANLPRMNWNNPAIRSNVAAIASQSGISGNRIVMLYTPPIGNQGSRGSCTGWATGYTALGILTYPDYNNWYFAERSPSYVFNQIKIDCLDGANLTDALNIIKNQGDCSINSMPYDENSCFIQPNSSQVAEASQHKAFMWSALDRNDVAGIKKAIDAGFPVVCGFYVYQSFKDMWNNGGTVWNSNTGNILGGHTCCIIGYDDTLQMFKSKINGDLIMEIQDFSGFHITIYKIIIILKRYMWSMVK